MINGFSIATLVVFAISIIFVIHPVDIPIPFKFPLTGKRKLSINLLTAPILGIAILWAAQCIAASTIRHGIVGSGEILPYNILILFFSLAYMAISLDVSGILRAAAFWVSNRAGSNGWKLYFYFYVMLTILSVVLGNDPVILSGTLFLVYFTEVAEVDPIAWLIAEFAAANTASMVLFVGNPTNVVICEGFGINNAAFTAYMILPFLGCNVACFFALILQFRKAKYIARKLPTSGDLDVSAVLRDPIAAWVGSLLLGSCLVVIIVVSFFHVDVWKISLPFAVAKFIFDLAWDHYQYVNRRGLEPKDAEAAMVNALKKHITHDNEKRDGKTTVNREETFASTTPSNQDALADSELTAVEQPSDTKGVEKAGEPEVTPKDSGLFSRPRQQLQRVLNHVQHHFPVLYNVWPRLPFALVPFAFSQFILIEGLGRQGWIDLFAQWLVKATHGKIFPTVWLMGVIGVVMCNVAGTNIGATILLTKVVNAASEFPPDSRRAAGISLALASNIGAVSFTFSASLAGLLWDSILRDKGITIGQLRFLKWNLLPLLAMTVVGLAIVSAEVAVLY